MKLPFFLVPMSLTCCSCHLGFEEVTFRPKPFSKKGYTEIYIFLPKLYHCLSYIYIYIWLCSTFPHRMLLKNRYIRRWVCFFYHRSGIDWKRKYELWKENNMLHNMLPAFESLPTSALTLLINLSLFVTYRLSRWGGP